MNFQVIIIPYLLSMFVAMIQGINVSIDGVLGATLTFMGSCLFPPLGLWYSFVGINEVWGWDGLFAVLYVFLPAVHIGIVWLAADR